MRCEDGMQKNQFPQWSLSLPLNIQGYQCICLCFHEWLWLMCFTAATSPLPMLFARMMEWKGLVCIVLHSAGCWQCRDVTGQLWFTASAGCSGLLSHCRCDTGKELGKYLLVGFVPHIQKAVSSHSLLSQPHSHLVTLLLGTCSSSLFSRDILAQVPSSAKAWGHLLEPY